MGECMTGVGGDECERGGEGYVAGGKGCGGEEVGMGWSMRAGDGRGKWRGAVERQGTGAESGWGEGI